MELLKELAALSLPPEFLNELEIESVESLEFDTEGPRQDVGH